MEVAASQFFHPVGHGTFLTGVAWSPTGEASFTWAYDCGSKRRTLTRAAIRDLSESGRYLIESKTKRFDLLVLSHFDDDHVNGVELFLETWSVKWLALPFLDLPARLAQAAGLVGGPCSDSTALFQIAPTKWLASRGLSQQVETILQVNGGPPPDDQGNPDEIPGEPRPSPKEGDNVEGDGEYRPILERYRPLSNGKSTDLNEKVQPSTAPSNADDHAMATLSHSTPFSAVGGGIEFMFYNSDQPDVSVVNSKGERAARRSKVALTQVEVEIEDIVKRYRIGVPGGKPKPNWREELRKIYDRHFGYSGIARNNISLCLMSRLVTFSEDLCARCSRNGQPRCVCVSASLMLGDLKVDSATSSSMRRHFGEHRWIRLAAVQVPHHGSQHSWEIGSASTFDAQMYVQCVPDVSPYHPHKTVEVDLASDVVKTANYQKGVHLLMVGGTSLGVHFKHEEVFRHPHYGSWPWHWPRNRYLIWDYVRWLLGIRVSPPTS
ncbi:hypothetical protein [Pseudomonas syringae]|uniref:hypothetical protein n=1 Tax=Pseudomonas syringae TaxID=317 RepID=UPI0003472720|nr:hypothetical protein [Pseudomonas syringae]AYL83199.1 hypothetical protein CN228_27905 [Pseudomonas syringae pv. actinidiae str. Shaanxi_M228]OSN79083.1 hypothetical protein BV352_04939 [Pseudomonas syringae pv. actinidiae]